MENKVLIKLIVPELDETYDVFIPVNEIMWKIKAMLVKCVSDLNRLPFNTKEDFVIINKDSGYLYQSNEIIIDTDIKNGTELVLATKM